MRGSNRGAELGVRAREPRGSGAERAGRGNRGEGRGGGAERGSRARGREGRGGGAEGGGRASGREERGSRQWGGCGSGAGAESRDGGARATGGGPGFATEAGEGHWRRRIAELENPTRRRSSPAWRSRVGEIGGESWVKRLDA
jgi:hypothetical protein